ncbi:MAG: NUDIX domain-containing protein [Hyphomonadaceae bacterium]
MTRFALQFGQTQPGVTYVERPTVYGLCTRGEKEIAVVRIVAGEEVAYDLPGGCVEANQDEADALMAEFLAETGLTVWPNRLIGRAGQYWNDHGAPKNALAAFYEVELSAADSDPTKPDHALVWVAPGEAMAKMRHEAHAWAILHWLRARKAALREETRGRRER